MAIQFKACPRCGGDIDTTYRDDVYCVQCAFRPTVACSSPRGGYNGTETAGTVRPPGDDRAAGLSWPFDSAFERNTDQRCPKCGTGRAVRLDKIRPQDNTCYRCRLCGHVFSPAVSIEPRGHRASLL